MGKRIKKTFSAKLMVLLIFVIFMPMAILSTYISYKLYHTAVQNDARMNQSSLEYISSSLKVYFNGFTHITDSIFISESLQNLLHTKPSTPYEKLLADRKYDETIQNITINNYDIESVYLMAADGAEYFSGGNRYITDIRKKCKELSDIKNYDFPLQTGFSTSSYLTGNVPVYITVIMQPVFNLETREYLGMAVLQFHANILNKLLDYNTDTTFITDASQNIIYDSSDKNLNHTLKDLFPGGLEQPVEYQNETMLPTYMLLENGCYLIQLKDYDTSNISFFMETVPVIWMFFACTIVFIIVAILMANKLIFPIKVLQSAMTEIQPDGLSSYVHIKTHDEFEDLGNSYNHMLNQIRLFIKKSYNQEIQHLNAEFRALQSQINPHFLYNALESINSMAQIKHQPEISRMTCCLADMFRYTTQQTEKLIPLGFEIQHVKNYFQLQSISCDNKVSLQYKISDRLLDYPVPKMILQPIIENCFNHAFDYKHLQIVLSAELDDQTLNIKITDNGKGFPDEKLKEIQRKLQLEDLSCDHGTSIGLLNINKRLKMLYHPDSGLEILSNTGEGTTVLLKLIEKEISDV